MRRVGHKTALVLGLGIDQGEQHQARVGGNICQNPVEMLLRAYHRPEMPDNVGIVELRQRGFGDHLQRFASRIGEEVKMEA